MYGSHSTGPEIDLVSRLHLGATFYLLEIYEGNLNPIYALESEGHSEGFSFRGFIKILDDRAYQCGLKDCSKNSFVGFTDLQGGIISPKFYFLRTEN